MLQKISELEEKAGIRLGLAQKILLSETGTVEQVLSILTGSEVRVKVVKQKGYPTTIIRNSTILNNTGKILIRARSKIFFHNLPSMVADQIKRKELGIGSIIHRSGLETYRKIIELGYDQENRSVLKRYQIIYRKRVAIEITEEILL
jgi:chorismate-pyruvate lyase